MSRVLAMFASVDAMARGALIEPTSGAATARRSITGAPLFQAAPTSDEAHDSRTGAMTDTAAPSARSEPQRDVCRAS